MRGAQAQMDIYRKNRPDFQKLAQENPPPKPPQVDPAAPKEKQDAMRADYSRIRNEWSRQNNEKMRNLLDATRVKWETEQARMERSYQNRQQQLANLAVILSRISPAAAMTYASMNMAGTGIEGHEHFLALARAFKEKFVEYVDRKLKESGMMTAGGAMMVMAGQRSPEKPVDISDLPAFQYAKERLSDILERVAVDLVLMALLTVLFFAGAYVSFLKYDVR